MQRMIRRLLVGLVVFGCLGVSLPAFSQQRVFLSSEFSDASLGGLDGADATCQRLADSQSLGGTWVAWLSDENNDARDRLLGDGPFDRLDGTRVAEDRAGLLSGNILAAIRVLEDGTFMTSAAVWTHTNADGTKYSSDAPCENWTMASGTFARRGQASDSQLGAAWTSTSGSSCERLRHLYCFEQQVVAVPSTGQSGLLLLSCALVLLMALAPLARKHSEIA